MEALEEGITRAVVESIWDRLTQDARELLKTEVRTRYMEEFQAETLTLARAQLQGEYEQLEVRLRDGAARQRQAMERDLEKVADEQLRKAREALERELKDEVDALRRQRGEARRQRNLAEAAAEHLGRALLPMAEEGVRWVYLWNAGVRSLALAEINAVLRRKGLVVRSRQVPASDRGVQVFLDAGRTEFRHEFVLDTMDPTAPDEDWP